MSDNARIDSDRVRFPGSSSLVTASNVPYGFFLNESPSATGSIGYFEYDCQASALWAARRLGYPIVDIEMIDVNFYACFEEAVVEYGAQVNQFNIRNNMLSLQGMPVTTNQNISGINVKGSGLPYVIDLAKQYGSEVGVGGNVEIKKFGVPVIENQQTYDLQDLIGTDVESGSRVEIRRVFHGPSPAFARIYDPFSMTGMSYSNVLNEMGFSGYSPATQFLMTPIFEDLLRGQAIEFNDTVRKSGFSFEIANNKLKLFPIPTYSHTVYVEYVVEKEKYNGALSSGSYATVSDYSNVPYQNITYKNINAVGKQWIRKYFLALCKETLGRILQKYTAIPIPGDTVTLDGAELRSEATAEKDVLMTQLRENLEASGRAAQIDAKANEADKMQETMRKIPLMIYIGAFVFSLIYINIQYYGSIYM
jgi:hypothetical protein